MAFVCPEKNERRKSLLGQLKELVNEVDDKYCPPCCPPPCVTDCCTPGPVIEIYDPLPKPCIPICSPCCGGPCPPCCSPGCPPCCPPSCPPCPPPSCPVPICCSPPCSPCPLVPPCLPICVPAPQPCVPICNPCPEEQPCVPCNPPQMMVCYKLPKNGNPLRKSKSRELRSSILYVGCDCCKRNGLQDDCPRSECQGAPECLTKPDPCCGPSQFCAGKHLGSGSGGYGKNLEEYQCYPAYVKMPNCCPPPCCSPIAPSCDPGSPCGVAPPCCGPSCCPPGCCPPGCCPPSGGCCPPPASCCPCVPLIAAPPCPPPICPGPPPLVPLGTIIPVCPPCPPPCCPCPCPC